MTIKQSEAKRGKLNPFYGKHHSQETLRKMSEGKKGKLNPMYRVSPKTKLNPNYCIDCGVLISRVSLRCAKCMGINNRDSNHPRWKGGITPMQLKIRNGIQTKLWRDAIFARDNWICQECGRHGKGLVAHHIKSFSAYPELRFAIDNGITLCVKCHKGTSNYCGRASRDERME